MSATIFVEGGGDSNELRARCRVRGVAARYPQLPNAYAKGKRSFAIIAELDPNTLNQQLPSFRRIRDVLDRKLR